MNWLAVLLTLGYAGQAGLLVVLGTDATPVLRAFAIGNALIAGTALWIWDFVLSSRGPRAARGSLLVVGVALLAPAFFLPSLAQHYEVARLGMRVGQTHLDDVTDEPGFVAVEVCDNGPGLTAELRENIFKPFATSKSQGMGLGLSICQTIVEAHGGTVRAISPPEGGTCFLFTLRKDAGKSGS